MVGVSDRKKMRAELLKNQNFKCAACEIEISKGCVDHSHLTKEVRGVLCGACNRALGHAEESPLRLRALAAYIEKYTNKP